MITILQGNVLEVLPTLPAASFRTCVTSPPYWGLRDYGHPEQLGLEETPWEYVDNMVKVFREVRRVLTDDGTLWLNLGDSYAGTSGSYSRQESSSNSEASSRNKIHNHPKPASTMKRFRLEADRSDGVIAGLKPKDLVGIPWRVAFALQSDGWFLRSDIIWHKPNPMPESVTDRPTKAHEYIFLLSKSPEYYYDADAIAEDCSQNTHARLAQNIAAQIGSDRANGGRKTNGRMKAVMRRTGKTAEERGLVKNHQQWKEAHALQPLRRNKRTVWTVSTAAVKEAHFATFPPALIRPCILAGAPMGGVVLDPFGGSGTTGEVAEMEGRNATLIELNPEYVKIIERRTAQRGLFAS